MNNKKYKLTNEAIEFKGRVLHRIQALKDFGDIKKGWLGGWVENENNLSHNDSSWIYDDARVYDNARVCDNALVYNNACLCGNAWIYDNARIYNDAWIYDNARVYNDARVCGDALVYSDAHIYGDAHIKEGNIIGKVSLPYKNIFQHQCKNRVLTAILTEENEIVYSVGCQSNIEKEKFLDRIYNENGGLKDNPHREEYLKIIECVELYFKK